MWYLSLYLNIFNVINMLVRFQASNKEVTVKMLTTEKLQMKMAPL